MMSNLVAAKVLLTGMIQSALKRDGKTIEEIITSQRSYAKSCDVELSELKRISQMRFCDLIGEGATESVCDIDEMVNRFLCWELPNDFAPDGGIAFKYEKDARGYEPSWPVGTNLFTADQAEKMIKHILKIK